MNLARWMLFAMALSLAACANQELPIGVIAPLTGDVASYGESVKAALVLAAQEINAEGGIAGKRVRLVFEDGKCEGAAAAAAAQRLINVERVPVIIGGLCSSETLAFAPLAQETGTLVISYCSAAPAITNAGDFIFRTYPSDTFQGKAAAQILINEGKRRAGVLHCDDEFCTGLAGAFSDAFKEKGGSAELLQFTKGAVDLRTQLTRLREQDPDVVYFIGFESSSSAAISQAVEMGWDVEFFGTSTWAGGRLLELTRGAAKGARYTVTAKAEDSLLAAKLKAPLLECAPQAYDALRIVAREMEGSPSRLKENLYAMPPYAGESGTISFDANGDLASADYEVRAIGE